MVAAACRPRGGATTSARALLHLLLLMEEHLVRQSACQWSSVCCKAGNVRFVRLSLIREPNLLLARTAALWQAAAQRYVLFSLVARHAHTYPRTHHRLQQSSRKSPPLGALRPSLLPPFYIE